MGPFQLCTPILEPDLKLREDKTDLRNVILLLTFSLPEVITKFENLPGFCPPLGSVFELSLL